MGRVNGVLVQARSHTRGVLMRESPGSYAAGGGIGRKSSSSDEEPPQRTRRRRKLGPLSEKPRSPPIQDENTSGVEPHGWGAR